MPKRSAVTTLPSAVKEWLDKALVESDFSGYEALSAALADKGYQISKSSLHRYGSEFEESLQAIKMSTEMAKAVVDACPDDAGNFGEALTRLVQQKSFEVLTKMEVDPAKVKLTDLGKMVSLVNRTSIDIKKYAAEVKQKTVDAAKEVEKVAKKGGLSDEAVQKIRRSILGIAET
jgi:Asp-tRNA(Asn)/Glu-tRNA(Gln) amidotransferase B subunit